MIKRYKIWFFTALVLVIFFIFSRLVSLTKLPIFVDEAIYLRWAQIAKNDANWRFISLTDGKQPLFVWLTMLMMKIVKDPLAAGRFVSVLVGLSSMFAVWGLSFFLFHSRRLAFFSAFLYLVSPFALIYDRMALMDGLVGFFSLLSLFLASLLVKTLRLDVALILGAALGGGVLTKTSGFLSIYFLPLTLLIFNWKEKKRWFNLLKWAFLVFLAIVVSQGFYSVLRLSPFFHIVGQKNAIFVFPFREWIQHPLLYLKSNLRGLIDWLVRYLTWPLIALAIFSLFLKKDFRQKILLFFWFLAPFAALAFFGRTLYPRFIFFMVLPLFVLAAWVLEELTSKFSRKWLFILLCLLIFARIFFIDFQLLFSPLKASLPVSDKEQYITSWPAGYGVKEIVAFAKEEAKDKKIFIATEGTFGLMPASLELYLWDNPNIQIKGFWPVKEVPFELLEKTKKMPVFFVFNETQKIPPEWPLRLIAKYPKPIERYSMKLYQVVTD